MGLDSALRFVRQRGSMVEQARLRLLLSGTPPSPQVIAQLFAGQQADGCWAAGWSAGHGSLDATCFRLAQAEHLGLVPDAPPAAQALAVLAQRQQPDGSWQEALPPWVTAPPWAAPGDHAATLYLTANCGFWLSRSAALAEHSGRAAVWLLAAAGAGADLERFPHTGWLASALWYACGYVEASERGLSRLSERITLFSAASLAWALVSLAVVGVPRGYPFVARAVTRLQSLQRADGAWPGDDGPARDVHTTLEALRAIRQYAHHDLRP